MYFSNQNYFIFNLQQAILNLFQNVNREMKRTYPDRRKLESQCISAIAFVRNEQELLDSPIWIMLINIVALEMLRVKLPAGGFLCFFAPDKMAIRPFPPPLITRMFVIAYIGNRILMFCIEQDH